MRANLGAVGWNLTAGQVAKLDAASVGAGGRIRTGINGSLGIGIRSRCSGLLMRFITEKPAKIALIAMKRWML